MLSSPFLDELPIVSGSKAKIMLNGWKTEGPGGVGFQKWIAQDIVMIECLQS